MIVSAAVVPHPPLLVPELAGAAAAETSGLREACVAAARHLADAGPRWVAVGAGERVGHHDDASCGSFAGFGADVRVALGAAAAGAEPDRELPLPLLVAGWLRAAVGADEVTVDGHVLPADTAPEDCVRRGAELAAGEDRVGLLVLGDGAATHAETGAAADAAAFDASVGGALRDGAPEVLAGLDPGRTGAVVAGGRVPWQVLAGAMPRPSRARLLHSSVPYGVGYHVALWTP